MKQLTETERYWADKPYKKWVVYVSKIRRRKTIKTDTLYVRASTYENACISGRNNSMLTGKTVVQARLASPADLGCIHTMTNNKQEAAQESQ